MISELNKITKIDGGSLEERINEAKEFFGLQEGESFQNLNIEDEGEANDDK